MQLRLKSLTAFLPMHLLKRCEASRYAYCTCVIINTDKVENSYEFSADAFIETV